jgi:hypothetical protein
MEQISAFERSYRVKAYFVFGIAMFVFFRRLISASMLSQMNHPLFLFSGQESIYNAFIATGIPQFITSSTVLSALLDVSLLVLTIGFLMSFNRLFAVAFWLVALNYFLTYNSVTGHPYHGMVGMLVMVMPFWFKKEDKFNLTWDLARYYFLYVFASAALWKLFRGSAFYDLQLTDILKSQQIDLLLQNPDNYKAHFVEYLISHTGISHFILLVNIFLQASFLIGFFTRKFDMVLFVLAIVFCISNYYVMGILSVELLILELTLLDWGKVEVWLMKKEVITTSQL